MSDTKIDAIVEAVVRELESKSRNNSGPSPTRVIQQSGGVKLGFQKRRGPTNLKVTVLGAGHGGLAMAGHLALAGFPVTLFSFFDRELDPVITNGGIEIVGEEVVGFAKLAAVTKSIDKAVKGADLIMVCAPAITHTSYATLLAGLLEDEQVVVLNPGRTGGALEFAQTLKRYAFRKRIYLAEAQTFIYAAELRGPGKVEVLHEKFKMRVAALPATDTKHVISVLNQVYPQIEPAQNVLETSINNIGPVVHPAPMLLNTSVIERVAQGEDIRYYKQQVTPTIAGMVMEKIDAEKVGIGKFLKLDAWTYADWYRESYGATGDGLYEVLQNNQYYANFHAPGHLLGFNHIVDEIPNSLVPLSSLAKQLELATPTIDAIIELGKVMTGIDFWTVGRTVEKMGVAGMTAEQMLEFVENTPFVGDCGQAGVCRNWAQFA